MDVTTLTSYNSPQKTCKVCKKTKQLICFNKAPGNKDGFNNKCKKCQCLYNKQYSEKQKLKHLNALCIVSSKLCPYCKEHKKPEDFYKNKAAKTGLTSFCKKCSRIKGKKWEQQNKEKIKKQRRNQDLLRKYGITKETYEKLLTEQMDACAICKAKEPGKNRSYFTVDHCHATGKVRGLLCAKCNCALGLLNDSPLLFMAAKKYLEKHDPDLI